MAPQAKFIRRGRVQIQHQVPKRTRGGSVKGVQTVFRMGGKGLQQDISYTQLIPGVFEGHDVMRIAGNGFGIFSHGKYVLTQIEHRDVLMMGMFGEEIQHTLVATAFIH